MIDRRKDMFKALGGTASDRVEIMASLQDSIDSVDKDVYVDSMVTASYDRQDVVEMCRVSLNFLAAMAMPDIFTYFFPSTHLTAWQILVDGEESAEERFVQFAIGIPRGHAKTTLIKLFVLRCILFSTRQFFLIAGATEFHAVNIIADIVDMLTVDNIRAAFGDYRSGLETDTRNFKKFGFRGRNIAIFGIGAGGAVRGTNVGNLRPDIIVMDDIQTKECSRSEDLSAQLLEWMTGTLMKSKSQQRCMFIFAGNMFPTPNSILRKLKNTATWTKMISGAILVDGTALWPEHRSLESLVKELENDMAMGQPHIFFAEVLNDTNAGVNTSVDYSKFPDWPWMDDDLPQGKFLLIDPSQGKGKDADVICTCEVYDAKIGIRAIHEGHYSPANLIHQALLIALRADVYAIAIEAMAYQSTLIFWFEKTCTDLGIKGLTFIPIYTNNTSKNSRIHMAIKAMQTHEVYLHKDVRSAVQRQIADWNPMKRDNKDDILDAISNAQKILAENTYDIMTRTHMLLAPEYSPGVLANNTPF